jgi:GTP cyclohydrolase I
MVGDDKVNKIPNKKDAKIAIDTLVRYIENIRGDLREGLIDTPNRVIESYEELYSGYAASSEEILDSTFNAEGYDGIVLLKDIEFHSTCEHHMLPFSGFAHIAYIPIDNIVGISKLARLVEKHAKQLQNQERITKNIAFDLVQYLKPLGAAVIIEASHGCMKCRGIKKQNSIMTTSAMKGVFFDKPEARTELMQLISLNK